MRILLVEDDSRIVGFLKRGLEAEGYAVDVAGEGQRACEMGESGGYDLVILDLVLPGKSGLDVCRYLREEKVQIPILMLTVKESVADKVRGFSAGADDYLTKPFSMEELLARLQALLRRTGQVTLSAQLTVDDLVLNRDVREVKRGEKVIELTPKEFVLLEYLMRNKGRALSREMIIEHVWGYDYDTFTNVVDVYIRRLREKIDQGYKKQLIQTVRSVGYKITG